MPFIAKEGQLGNLADIWPLGQLTPKTSKGDLAEQAWLGWPPLGEKPWIKVNRLVNGVR